MRPEDPRHGTAPSLWLLPDEAHRLTPVLKRLALAHGGPPFPPHLTLLGSVSGAPSTLIAQTTALANRLSPLVLPTAAISGEDRWFRCLTLQVLPAPMLQTARMEAERIFAMPSRPWTPHISLLYGALSASQRADAIADLPPLPDRVRLSTLVLVGTIGPAEQWVELARFSLSD